MSTLEMYSVYDSKVQAHLKPFCMRNAAEAVRAFGDLVNDPGVEFSKHPEDYSLVHIGTWDEDAGMLIPNTAPITLVSGKQLSEQAKLQAQRLAKEFANEQLANGGENLEQENLS